MTDNEDMEQWDDDDLQAPRLLDFTRTSGHFEYKIKSIRWVQGGKRKIEAKAIDKPRNRKKTFFGNTEPILKTLIIDKGCLETFPRGTWSPYVDYYFWVNKFDPFGKMGSESPTIKILGELIRKNQLNEQERENIVEDMIVSDTMRKAIPMNTKSISDDEMKDMINKIKAVKDIDARQLPEPKDEKDKGD